MVIFDNHSFPTRESLVSRCGVRAKELLGSGADRWGAQHQAWLENKRVDLGG